MHGNYKNIVDYFLTSMDVWALRGHFYSCMGLVVRDTQDFCKLTVVNGTPGIGASQLGIRAKVNDYLGSSVGVELRYTNT